MLEVESIGLLKSKHQKEERRSNKVIWMAIVAVLGLSLGLLGYNFVKRPSMIVIPTVPAYQGSPKSAEEIIHYAHYLSVQASSSQSGNVLPNFLSKFMKEYRSIRTDYLSIKDKENIETLEDVVSVLEQRDSVPIENQQPSKFWETVMPLFDVKPEMVLNPSLSQMKTYTGKLAHSNPEVVPSTNKDDPSINLKLQSNELEGQSISQILNMIETLSLSKNLDSKYLELVGELLDKASETSTEVLQKVVASATTSKSASVALFVSKIAPSINHAVDREGLLFLLSFEVCRLSSDLTPETQLLSRVIETVAQNWSRYRYLNRGKVDRALGGVYPSIKNKELLAKGAIHKSPVVDESQSEGAWIELAKNVWK